MAVYLPSVSATLKQQAAHKTKPVQIICYTWSNQFPSMTCPPIGGDRSTTNALWTNGDDNPALFIACECKNRHMRVNVLERKLKLENWNWICWNGYAWIVLFLDITKRIFIQRIQFHLSILQTIYLCCIIFVTLEETYSNLALKFRLHLGLTTYSYFILSTR